MVREITESELDSLLELYLFLHEDSIPEKGAHLRRTWAQILRDDNHHILVNEVDGNPSLLQKSGIQQHRQNRFHSMA